MKPQAFTILVFTFIFVLGGFVMIGYILDDYYLDDTITLKGLSPTGEMVEVPATFICIFGVIGVFSGVFVGYRAAWHYSIAAQVEKETEIMKRAILEELEKE